MSEIAVLCPTRRGPGHLAGMVKTMIATSTRARVYAYVDDDQRTMYQDGIPQQFGGETPGELIIHSGPRIGPVAACNELVAKALPGTRIFGMVPDDAEFRTKGWDDWLVRTIDSFPGRLGVASAAHNYGGYVNFPWVSADWIQVVGWYFYPKNFHFCCDTILELLGDATNIVHAKPEEFQMFHHGLQTLNPNAYPDAANAFLHWTVVERRDLIMKIKAAIDAAR